MDISKDLFNDLESVSPKVATMSTAESDALQDRDEVLEKLRETNKALEDLNDNINRIVGGNLEIENAICKVLSEKAADAINSFVATMQKETVAMRNGIRAESNALKTESERAANRLKKAENVVIISEKTAYISAIILILSVSFFIVMTVFNVNYWHSSFLTSLILSFIAITTLLIALVVVYFHYWHSSTR